VGIVGCRGGTEGEGKTAFRDASRRPGDWIFPRPEEKRREFRRRLGREEKIGRSESVDCARAGVKARRDEEGPAAGDGGGAERRKIIGTCFYEERAAEQRSLGSLSGGRVRASGRKGGSRGEKGRRKRFFQEIISPARGPGRRTQRLRMMRSLEPKKERSHGAVHIALWLIPRADT
jgi:hypothetical protein